MPEFNYEPLSLTDDETRRTDDAVVARDRSVRRSRVLALVATGVIAIPCLFFSVGLYTELAGAGLPVIGLVVAPLPCLFAVAFYVLSMRGEDRRIDVRDITSERLQRFADVNGLRYVADLPANQYHGKAFSCLGLSQVLMHDEAPLFEFGRMKVADDAGQPAVELSYIRLPAGTDMPDMMLNAKKNDTSLYNNFSKTFKSYQQINLEGDFNTVFDLYVAAGDNLSVRYLLPPDIMAVLIDTMGEYDIEMRGDAVYVYCSTVLDPLDVTSYTVVSRVVDSWPKMARSWGRSTLASDDTRRLESSLNLRKWLAKNWFYIVTFSVISLFIGILEAVQLR